MYTNDVVGIHGVVNRWFQGDQVLIKKFFNTDFEELEDLNPNEYLLYKPEKAHHLRSLVDLLLRRHCK